MEEITLEELRQYLGIVMDIRALQDQIRETYEKSPAPQEVIGGRSSVSTPGDPTAAKAMKLIRQREKLEEKQKQQEALKEKIEAYVEIMPDRRIAAMIRWRFLLGHSWSEVCRKAYGYPDPDICRMAVNEYFKKQRKDKQ